MSRSSRSASIPVPRPPSASRSPTRGLNINAVIPLATSISPARPRMVTASSSVTAPSPIATAGTSSQLRRASITAAARPFEPRVIRVCDPPATLTRPRRRSSTMQPTVTSSSSLPPTHSAPPAPTPTHFRRPSYLAHSALRHLLHTEAASAIALPPPTSNNTATSGPPEQTDSEDDDFTPAPQRRVLAARFSNANDAPIVDAEGRMLLPTQWSEEFRHHSLTLSDNGRCLEFHGPSSAGDKDAAAARADAPAPPACGIYYFEVTIVNKGQKGHISIGLIANTVRLSRLPGWEQRSWGYHADDGFAFAADRSGNQYGPMYGTGDIIGCGIDFSAHHAFYTKNGTYLGPVFDLPTDGTQLYPSVGMRHAGESVRVNFGQDLFEFDIEDHVRNQARTAWERIMATTSLQRRPIAEGVKIEEGEDDNLVSKMPDIVAGYLEHQGYSKASRAFRAQRAAASPAGISITKTDDADNSAIEERVRIVRLVASGEAESALATIASDILDTNGGFIRFKLRCLAFIQLILEASALKKAMPASSHSADAMDVDDTSSSIPTMRVTWEAAVQKAINYGQGLQFDYKEDERLEIKNHLLRTFGIVACVDPLDSSAPPEVQKLVSAESRQELAAEVNRAILQTQGRPAQPALERIYRQSAACVQQLGLMGVGTAAFVDINRELFERDLEL